MFCVDEDATVTIKNGEIHMINGNNHLYIDATNFIRWIINGEDKFYYDKTLDAIVFKGKIIGSEIEGGTIKGSDIYGAKYYKENGSAYMMIGADSGNYADLALYNNNGNERFKIYDDGMSVWLRSSTIPFLGSSGNSSTMRGTWKYNNSEVATKDDLLSLLEQLSK